MSEKFSDLIPSSCGVGECLELEGNPNPQQLAVDGEVARRADKGFRLL